MRVSAGGDLLAITGRFHTLAIRGGILRSFYFRYGQGFLVPGPDGRTIYTGDGGVRDGENRELRPRDIVRPPAGPITLLVPWPDPAYYLGIADLPASRLGNPYKSPDDIRAIVYRANGDTLCSVNGLIEMQTDRADLSRLLRNDFTIDKRFHLIPAAKLLITIPFTNDMLVLRRLDLERPSQERPSAK